MSDIFKEVEEDIRRDHYKRLWDRFGPYVLGLAVLIVAATAGYRGWEYLQEREAQATGDRFLEALQLSTDGKHDEAIAAFDVIAKGGSGGYPVLARFRIATEKAHTGDKTGAVADFDAIAADKSVGTTEVKNLARLRSALLLVDTATVADLTARIGDLASTGNSWRHAAREILGLAAWRSGEYATARKYYNDIYNDQGSADDLRQRAQLMLALIGAKLGQKPRPRPCDRPPPPPQLPPRQQSNAVGVSHGRGRVSPSGPRGLASGACSMPSHHQIRVAIVGRPNVGKSTLFNRLVGRRLALVDDLPGVTRDRREGEARLAGLEFTAIDTAGLDDAAPESLGGRMRLQTEAAVRSADVSLFLIDARAGVTPLDQHFAAMLRTVGKPIILVANKSESKAGAAGAIEAFELGLGEPIPISAEHGEVSATFATH